jgi:type VI secretion system protein ImpJ
MSMLWPNCFGLVTLALDLEAIKNGTLNLLHASGIMPDGMPFNMPGSDSLPEPRNFSKLFPPDRYTLTLSLAITARQPNGLNCVVDNGLPSTEVRFIAETSAIADETSGTDDKPVRLGRKNFRLLLDSELTSESVALPVARILRSGTGEFIPDPDFIPPCLQLGASPRLMYLTGRLIEIMQEKGTSLIRSTGSGDALQFASREIAAFWFLHVINSSLGPLRHQYASKRGHPEELFIELLRLAGGLCTFTLDSHPRMLPAYDHLHPDVCFADLDKRIRDYLELIIPTSCLRIPLSKTAECFYAGPITDERSIGRVTWLLGVRSSIGQIDLMTKVPQLVKVCSERFIGELVRRQMPGLRMSHVPAPPPAVAPRPETQYFLVDRSGPFWENIVQTRHVGIYIPEEIANPELELLVILE